MKLKNFIKKSKRKKERTVKSYLSNNKVVKKASRVEEKSREKSTKRIVLLSLIAILIFTLILLISLGGYFYKSFIEKKLQEEIILSPGQQNIINVDDAKKILLEHSVSIGSAGYASGSGVFTLKIEGGGPTVYFSENLDFKEQVKLLKRILENLNLEDKDARVIDLRYNKPIVKF